MTIASEFRDERGQLTSPALRIQQQVSILFNQICQEVHYYSPDRVAYELSTAVVMLGSNPRYNGGGDTIRQQACRVFADIEKRLYSQSGAGMLRDSMRSLFLFSIHTACQERIEQGHPKIKT